MRSGRPAPPDLEALQRECGLLVGESVRTALISLALAIAHVPHAHGEPADDALAAGEYRQALAGYRRVLRWDPLDHHALREGGRAAHAMRDFATSAHLLALADGVAYAPDPELHALLGEAQWMLGREASAAAAFRRVLGELDPNTEDRCERLWLAQSRFRLGNLAMAERLYGGLAAQWPDDADIAFGQAETYAAMRRWADAERAIRRLLVYEPNSARARDLLAWIVRH